jgi:hypothetical protein
MPKRAAKLGSAFYGDVGTKFTEPAREGIQKQELQDNLSHGDTAQTGNDVDFSQRHAPSESDEYSEQAERIVRTMERHSDFKYSGQFSDPEKRRQFVEGLAEQLRGKSAIPVQQQEPEEKPFSSNEFWSDPEEVKRAARAVRPPKL